MLSLHIRIFPFTHCDRFFSIFWIFFCWDIWGYEKVGDFLFYIFFLIDGSRVKRGIPACQTSHFQVYCGMNARRNGYA